MTQIREKFRKYPLLGSLIVMGLYILFMYAAIFVQGFLVPQTTFISYLWINFLFVFGFLALLLLIVVPKGLHLPQGDESLSEYFETIGFTHTKPLKQNLVLGVMSFLTFFILGFISLLFFAGEVYIDFNAVFGWPTQSNRGIFNFIAMLRPGIWEEVAFRGVILVLLMTKYSKRTSIFIDGVLFGALHLINIFAGAALLPTIFQIIYASFYGFFLAYMFTETRSLVAPITTHYLINVFGKLLQAGSMTLFTAIMVVIMLSGILPSIINLFLIKWYTGRKKDLFNSIDIPTQDF